jgi:hypothetical protein
MRWRSNGGELPWGVDGGSGCSYSSEEEGRDEVPIVLKETTRRVSSHRGAGEAATPNPTKEAAFR